MKHRETNELNEKALKVLEDNQLLQMYAQLRRGG